MTIESRSPGNAFGKWIPSTSLTLRLESPLRAGSTSVFFEIRPLAEVVGFKFSESFESSSLLIGEAIMNCFSLFLSMLVIIGSVEYSSAELIFYFGLRPIFIGVDVVSGVAGGGQCCA